MQGDEQRVVAIVEPDQPRAGERAGFKIERRVAFLDRQALQRALAVALVFDVIFFERKPDARSGDALNGLAVDDKEGGSQGLVPSD